MTEKIYVFDTTLRDGEQSAGVAFTPEEKLEIARQLDRLGVDIIEAGFPCSTPGDLEAVQTIAREVRRPTIAALARAVASDIDTAWEAVKEAAEPRIHVFINSSDIQMAHQLGKDREQVLTQAEAMVRHAAKYTSNVEFSPMDATRADPRFIFQIVQRCIDAGATTINIPDSVGYAIPEELGGLFRAIFENVPNIHKCRVSFHGQNDLGMCTANTLTAIQNGARQVELTINGIGERAGNTSLEEVVMAIKTRKDFLPFYTDINTREIWPASKMVERYSGIQVQWNKAVVGKNAFRHASGIHQDGILKLRETWEIMDPTEIGMPRENAEETLVLGKLSGRHAFKIHMARLGYQLNENQLAKAFAQFKELADKKIEVDNRDLIAIVNDNLGGIELGRGQLGGVQVTTGDHITPTATVTLTGPEGERTEVAMGTGPVNAIYKAINAIAGVNVRLDEYLVKAVTENADAQGEVTVRLEEGGRTWTGRASDTDVIVASAKAYIAALNRMAAVAG
ncbi:MAG TPA: 2-isopropylmalate synthase [Tepidiformaceae bacterium]|nr:2-isopropylmalate synthase [Tepidiformaceae bacterium]